MCSGELTRKVANSSAESGTKACRRSRQGGWASRKNRFRSGNVFRSDLLKAIFEGKGFRMELARTGREAVDMWEKGEYDLIIMDVQMQKMDGIDATRLIREKEQASGRHIPIMAMTAHAYQEEQDRCREAGMDAFLPKPLDLKKGIEVIRALTGKNA